MPAPTLLHLTVKPFSWCSHNCPYCDSRQELFQETREQVLGLDDWAQVFADANALGTEYLDISGGEPSLYKGLLGMVWEAKRHGWFVSMNSTGVFVPDLLDPLISVGLDQIIISLVSLHSANHDRIRSTPGSWDNALSAIRAIQPTPIRLVIHFIVNRHNYRELPDLVDAAFAWKANALSFVYPENDAAARYLLMTEEQILELRHTILPETLRRYERYYPMPHRGHANISHLFAPHGTGGDFASGIYWQDFEEVRAICDKPNTFALIYANGDVLPCNAVEYTHAQRVGNVLRQSLREIWHGEAYDQFRRERMLFCRMCPIKRHTGIAISTQDNPPYQAPVVRQVPVTLPLERPHTPEDHLKLRVPGKVRRQQVQLQIVDGHG